MSSKGSELQVMKRQQLRRVWQDWRAALLTQIPGFDVQQRADLATRQPRASLSLTGRHLSTNRIPFGLKMLAGAAATSLAADADRLQGLSDEIVVAKAQC